MGGTIEVCHSCGKARHGVSEAGCLEELRRKAAKWDEYVGGLRGGSAKAGSCAELIEYKELLRILRNSADLRRL